MGQSHLITVENLIGSIAGAILELKKIKERKKSDSDTSFLFNLIDFIEKANNEDYHNLLYNKYFIVSEDVLGNLHHEFKENDISNKIDFKNLKESLLEITKQSSVKIEESMGKLREIAMILLQIKNQRQIHMLNG